MAVAERQQHLTMAVRDYLNAGGKLIHAGESALHQGLEGFSTAVGGLYYGLNGDEKADRVIQAQPNSPHSRLLRGLPDHGGRLPSVLPRWVHAYRQRRSWWRDRCRGAARRLYRRFDPPPSTKLDEAGVYQPTSEVLPAHEFPQFTSHGSVEYITQGVDPFAPVEGTRYAGAVHADASYMRLQRTIDLTAPPRRSCSSSCPSIPSRSTTT